MTYAPSKTEAVWPDVEFEAWLRTVCISAPPAEALDLARCAYRFGLSLATSPAPVAPSERQRCIDICHWHVWDNDAEPEDDFSREMWAEACVFAIRDDILKGVIRDPSVKLPVNPALLPGTP